MKQKIRWKLWLFDAIIYLIVCFALLFLNPNVTDDLGAGLIWLHVLLGFACLCLERWIFKIYQQIWRYAGASEYVWFFVADAIACLEFIVVTHLFLEDHASALCLITINATTLLGSVAIRLLYQTVYQKRASEKQAEKFMLKLLRFVTGVNFGDEKAESNQIRVAIIGAGSVGVMLADELLQNPKATYQPVCFVDVDRQKTGRIISKIPVLDAGENERLKQLKVQEVVFAIPNVTMERRNEIYEIYNGLGYKIKTYDYPVLDSGEGGKRHIHDFDIEDLLFRSANKFLSEETMSWYQGKNVLITGGGGSIGSELARQIASCNPERLVILDVYENGAYDVQQELKIKYGEKLNLRVEIASVCDLEKIEKIFRENTPDIVLHAAAHKHVPLMERNVCEAVSNNVFGTLNVVKACEKFGVKRFIMVSTDKAVNPTNVMGATKRMCEMIVQSRTGTSTSFSATRFGNVLGSNGSVIPLFKRQIANGGPITITDKRIIRYFMTIPEASQLVMTSGAMAKNGELYVLDMGKPVKILNLAENMVKLSGLEPYKDIDIIETGLRPGEKLYEELLIKTEELDKTDNDMIFVERDKPLPMEEIEQKIEILRQALESQSNHVVKKALMQVVPTYHTPEEVNEKAIEAEEIRMAAGA